MHVSSSRLHYIGQMLRRHINWQINHLFTLGTIFQADLSCCHERERQRLLHWFFQKALRSQPSLPVGSLPLLAPHDPLEKLQVLNLCQARSQPVFSGKPGMISRDHFVCPVPSFSEMKEMDEEKCYGFRKTGKLGLTWLTGSYAPSCCWILSSLHCLLQQVLVEFSILATKTEARNPKQTL